jgi:hypothetical protein
VKDSLLGCTITVRSSGNTYLARLNGKSASCTCGAEAAARNVLRKLDPARQYAPTIAATHNGRAPRTSYWLVVRAGEEVGEV